METGWQSPCHRLYRVILLLAAIALQPVSVTQAGPADDVQWMLQVDLSFGAKVPEYRFRFGVAPDLGAWRPAEYAPAQNPVILPLLTHTWRNWGSLAVAEDPADQGASDTAASSWDSEEVIWGAVILIGTVVVLSDVSDTLSQDPVGPVDIEFPELSPEVLDPPSEAGEE